MCSPLTSSVKASSAHQPRPPAAAMARASPAQRNESRCGNQRVSNVSVASNAATATKARSQHHANPRQASGKGSVKKNHSVSTSARVSADTAQKVKRIRNDSNPERWRRKGTADTTAFTASAGHVGKCTWVVGASSMLVGNEQGESTCAGAGFDIVVLG